MKTPLLLALAFATALPAAQTPPVVYTGTERATSAADGGLRPITGVQNIQVYRANRTASTHADALNHTYSHAPMLAYWRGRFYLEYLSAPVNEHDPATVNSLTTSTDGLTWAAPRVIFPAFALPNGSQSINHQRMGFYVAPDNVPNGGGGRLLVLGFYGKYPSPNDGTGLGRAVRDIRADGSLGPIHMIRLVAKQPFPNFLPPYPLYNTSTDRGFVAACDALLADQLMTAQWWEEDALDESGFYKVRGKALSFVTRPDGSTLGIWKDALVATTADRGATWTNKIQADHLPANGSKYWLQRTADRRYALVHNPTNRLRHPLAVTLSDDAARFSGLFTIHSELPDQRFGGGFKNMGPQYVRGIIPGNGTPPGDAMWLTYSVNKEDIWIARVPVPLTPNAPAGPVRDDFNTAATGTPPAGWNIYSPLWAPVRVVDAGAPAGRALELRDEEPCDYARAVRLFPATHGVKISFKLLARQTTARLEIDLLDAKGARPVRLSLGENGRLSACHEGQWFDAGAYTAGRWHAFELEIPASPTADRCAVVIDGQSPLTRPAYFTEPIATVERLSFRTGAFRDRGYGGRDLPGADQRVPAAAFLIDDVVITPVGR